MAAKVGRVADVVKDGAVGINPAQVLGAIASAQSAGTRSPM